MSKRGLSSLLWVLLAALLPLAGFLYLKMNASHDYSYSVPRAHFYIVSGASLLAAVSAFLIGIAGARLRNIQVTFLSMALISLALIFSLHGLSTPGFLLPHTLVPPIAAQLSILLTAFWMWLSSCPSDLPIVRTLSRWHRWLVPAWTALLTVIVVVGMRFPGLVAFLPLNLSPLNWGVTALVLGLALMTARHYWISYRYSRFPLQLAILFSTGWLAVSQVIIVSSEPMRASWWIYHFLLLAGTIVILYGVARQYSLGASIGSAVQGLVSSDPVERIEAGIAPSVRALVIAAEMRDRYTAGHNYRVAILALRLAEAMGLSPERLRALAQSGVVHDIGKIEIPDHILNKPGKLSPEERAIVERHPVTGYEMCKRLGFMQDELDGIRHHHEKWDGKGYPDHLKGDQIPLLARILAITDVYDALTSTRSYRMAWTHEAAMALIQEESGRQFDPVCVAAWVRISQMPPAMDRYPTWLQTEQAVREIV